MDIFLDIIEREAAREMETVSKPGHWQERAVLKYQTIKEWEGSNG